MLSPHNLHEVQRLVNRVVAAQSIDKFLPFFKVLRKAQEWDATYEKAFSNLKEYLAHPPLLSQMESGEDLTVYLAVSPHATSVVLVQDMKEG